MVNPISRKKIIPMSVVRIILIFALVVVLLRVSFITEAMQGFLVRVIAPFWNAEQFIYGKFNENSSLVSSKKKLLFENKNLLEKQKSFEAQFSFLSILKKENKELKELLDLGGADTDFVFATILSHPGSSPYDTFVINRGYEDGLKEGDIVGVYGGGVILGTIERVYEKNAIVRLFSSPGKKVDVFIGKEEIPTEAEGMGGGNFTVIIPKGIEVYKEDAVRFKIDTINLLGTVESVSATASDAFQTVVFQTPVNIYTLKWVEVFLGNVDVNTVIEE